MFSSKKLEDKAPTVALLDVDDTLIIRDHGADPVADDVEQIKTKLRAPGVLNLDLIKALKAARIKDVYLFTDMTFNKNSLQERLALAEVLKEDGFIVHGTITPADCAWHLPQKPLQALAESKDVGLLKQIDRLREAGKNEEAQKLLSELQQNLDYQAVIKNPELKGTAKPGRAFAEAVEVINNKELLHTCALRGMYAKSFADRESLLHGMSHVKGKMLQCLVNHNQHGFKKFVVCDDRLDVLESIKQANDTFHEPVDAVTVYINNNRKRKSPGEQSKSYSTYLNEINAPAVLNNACADYKAHLEKVINDAMKNNDNDESKCGKDENFVLAKKKLAAVKEIHATLGKTVGHEQLKAFRAKLIEHRLTLEKRRDTWSRWFLRVAATVFSLGIAAAFGIWKVTGKEMTKAVEPFVSAKPGMS